MRLVLLQASCQVSKSIFFESKSNKMIKPVEVATARMMVLHPSNDNHSMSSTADPNGIVCRWTL